MTYQTERQVAKKAEQMLQFALRSKTAGFKAHISKENKPSLKEVTAKARVKKYGLVRQGTAKYYMRRLDIKMAKHGFVQHYGVDTVRAGGERTRKIPKQTTYRYKHHYFNMKATPFIDGAIESSGVVPFVLDNITRLRTEEVFVHIKKFLEK